MPVSTSISIVTCFLVVAISLFVLSVNYKNNINRFFFFLGLSIGMWTLCNILADVVHEYDSALFFTRISTVWVILLPIFFNKLITNLYFSSDKTYLGKQSKFLFILYLITLFITIFSQTPFNVVDIRIESWGVDFIPGVFYYILFFYLIFGFGFSFIYLFRAFKKSINPQKTQIKLILIGTFLSVLLSIVTGILFPIFGYSYISVYTPSTSLFFLAFIAYSITRHHLFNIKIIAIEIITFGLWIFILIRILFVNSIREAYVEIGLLGITVVFGIMLIRTMLNETNQRQKIETLATDLKSAYTKVHDTNEHLEQKVAEQTKQIREAYEVEKRARHELEMLNEAKDQFIMITQHHLRTPLTSIRWQIEEMLKGTHGQVNPELKIALTQTNEATNKLTHIINDFLNITAAKAGTKILNISPASLLPVFEKVLHEQREVVNQKKITITYDAELNNWPELPVDATKMGEVISILIENAITYNESGGAIEIVSQKNENEFEFIVKSSGPHIHEEAQTKIFKELFYRSKEAQKINPTGMGVGLIVAKSIVAAHKGKIEISNSFLSTKKPCVMVRITLPLN